MKMFNPNMVLMIVQTKKKEAGADFSAAMSFLNIPTNILCIHSYPQLKHMPFIRRFLWLKASLLFFSAKYKSFWMMAHNLQLIPITVDLIHEQHIP